MMDTTTKIAFKLAQAPINSDGMSEYIGAQFVCDKPYITVIMAGVFTPARMDFSLILWLKNYEKIQCLVVLSCITLTHLCTLNNMMKA